MLTSRAGRDEDISFPVAGLDGDLPERVCLLGLAVDFEGAGADIGLLCSSADLLMAGKAWLGPCPVLFGLLVGLLGFSMALLEKNLMQTVVHLTWRSPRSPPLRAFRLPPERVGLDTALTCLRRPYGSQK